MLQCWRTCERMKHMKFFPDKKKHQVFLGAIVSIFVVVTFFVVKVKTSNAILGFGGKVTHFEPCPESANYAIFITGRTTSGYFMWEPTTINHTHGSQQLFSTGSWALGTYAPVGVCVISIVPPVTIVPIMGTMIRVGTSLAPI